jgi:signal transduction histidine kinase
MRTWRRRAGDSAERLRLAQAEHAAQTRQAVEAERARIASELHDVVTHNVSVMVVQAGAARSVLASSPEQGQEAQTAIKALLAVEGSGRTAMGELRHLLGLLAPTGDHGPTGDAGLAGEDVTLVPQPGLGQVQALVGRVRAAGLPVELIVTEGARPLPPGVDLAAYRVVQEALTNVARHAGPATAEVCLEYSPALLTVSVTDDGRAVAAGAVTPGVGLRGMRERVTGLGGTLHADRRDDGGFAVRATFPLDGGA